MNELSRIACISDAMNELEKNGYKVCQLTNFDLVPDLARRLGKTYLTPQLDPQLNDFTPANCFWLVVKFDGKPIAMGGVRYDDLGGQDVAEFWKRTFARHYEGGINDIAPPISAVVNGRIAYLGDLFVDPTARGSRTYLKAAFQICHFLISLKWDPDSTYAFLRESDVARGAGWLYGFTWTIERSKSFATVNPPRSNEECCAVLTRADLMHRAEVLSRN